MLQSYRCKLISLYLLYIILTSIQYEDYKEESITEILNQKINNTFSKISNYAQNIEYKSIRFMIESKLKINTSYIPILFNNVNNNYCSSISDFSKKTLFFINSYLISKFITLDKNIEQLKNTQIKDSISFKSSMNKMKEVIYSIQVILLGQPEGLKSKFKLDIFNKNYITLKGIRARKPIYTIVKYKNKDISCKNNIVFTAASFNHSNILDFIKNRYYGSRDKLQNIKINTLDLEKITTNFRKVSSYDNVSEYTVNLCNNMVEHKFDLYNIDIHNTILYKLYYEYNRAIKLYSKLANLSFFFKKLN